MNTLIAGTFGVNGVCREAEDWYSLAQKAKDTESEAEPWVAWRLERILEIHVRLGRAHRITESLVGMERDIFKSVLDVT